MFAEKFRSQSGIGTRWLRSTPGNVFMCNVLQGERVQHISRIIAALYVFKSANSAHIGQFSSSFFNSSHLRLTSSYLSFQPWFSYSCFGKSTSILDILVYSIHSRLIANFVSTPTWMHYHGEKLPEQTMSIRWVEVAPTTNQIFSGDSVVWVLRILDPQMVPSLVPTLHQVIAFLKDSSGLPEFLNVTNLLLQKTGNMFILVQLIENCGIDLGFYTA